MLHRLPALRRKTAPRDETGLAARCADSCTYTSGALRSKVEGREWERPTAGAPLRPSRSGFQPASQVTPVIQRA
ncbi:hypothetical protein QR685DRAFT_303430 [Neurospora intermedia]|uniref:Uncharacterized protein n=1 Tax=Neurospora intermedia TaxID=5142 RepID=A0ABR3DBB1_NEUIN